MARKILLDVDPGIADAMALCLALGDPGLDVVAVTATGGNVSPDQATRNVQALVEQLDPEHWPRLGAADPDQILRSDGRQLYGEDGLCGAEMRVAELHHLRSSKKVIADAGLVAASGSLAGILDLCDEPLVSVDFTGNPHSSIVDALSTKIIDGGLVKVLAWYDNEWGYSQRVVDLAVYIGERL